MVVCELLSVFTSVRMLRKPDAISSELSYRPNPITTVARTVYPWYCWSLHRPYQIDHIWRQGRWTSMVWLGKEKVYGRFPLVLAFLLTQFDGKNLQGDEWSFQWSSKQSNFDKFPSNRWNGENWWDFRLLARDAATFTRKYKACSSSAMSKQVWLNNRWKPWKSSKNAKWS